MCKKIAGGAQRIVLDVKLGRGAFMDDLESARILAETMVRIGKQTGREAIALLSDMNQPLGSMVGNALEVREAVETLRGGGPQDFRQHCIEVASHMLVLGELASDERSGVKLAEGAIASGKALERFRELVRAQGGDVSYVDDLDKLPNAAIEEIIPADRVGYLAKVDALLIGEAAVLLGAGRAKKGDPIDHAVGIKVHHKVGDRVEASEPVLTLYANRETALAEARIHLSAAFEVSEEQVAPLPLFYDVVRWNNLEI